MVATKKQPNGTIKITDEQLALFRTVMAIRESDDDLTWEEDGGRRREYLDVGGQLHDLLGLALWDLPVTSDNVARDAASWPVRQALDAAMAQDGAGRPLVNPQGNGVRLESQLEKCTREALAQLRSG